MKIGNFVLATLAKSSIKMDALHQAIKSAYYPNEDWMTLSEFESAIHNNTLMATDFIYITSLLRLDLKRLTYYSDVQCKGVNVEASKKKVLDVKDIYDILLKESVYLDKGIKYELTNILKIKNNVFQAYYENDNCSVVAMEEVEQLEGEVKLTGIYYNDEFIDFIVGNGGTVKEYKAMDLVTRRKSIKEEGEFLYQLYPDRKASNVKMLYI